MGQPWIAHVTLAEYDGLPEDGNRYEILEGVLVMSPAPDPGHQTASWNISALFVHWLEVRPKDRRGRFFAAPVDVVLAYDTVVQPDLVYVLPQRVPLLVHSRIHGPPDLAVEIFRKRSADRDRVAKLSLYARFKVPEFWLVDLDERTLTLLVLEGDAYVTLASGSGDGALASRVLEGFTLRPDDVFEGV